MFQLVHDNLITRSTLKESAHPNNLRKIYIGHK